MIVFLSNVCEGYLGITRNLSQTRPVGGCLNGEGEMSACSPFLTLLAFLRQHPDTGVSGHCVSFAPLYLPLRLQLLLEFNPRHDCGPPFLPPQLTPSPWSKTQKGLKQTQLSCPLISGGGGGGESMKRGRVGDAAGFGGTENSPMEVGNY